MYTHEQLHDAMHLLTLFTSGDTDISQIGLELASLITSIYCIQAVELCFPLDPTAELRGAGPCWCGSSELQ